MVIIRLARYGRKKLPIYNILVADRRKSCNGKFIIKIGYYNPFLNFEYKKGIYINLEILNIWLKYGAILSKRVSYLLNKYKKILIN